MHSKMSSTTNHGQSKSAGVNPESALQVTLQIDSGHLNHATNKSTTATTQDKGKSQIFMAIGSVCFFTMEDALGLVQAHAQGHLSSVMGVVIVMYLLSLSIICCSMVLDHMPIELKESAKKDFLKKLLLVLSIGRVLVGIIHIYRVVDTIAAVFALLIISAIYGFAYFLIRCRCCCNTEYCNRSNPESAHQVTLQIDSGHLNHATNKSTTAITQDKGKSQIFLDIGSICFFTMEDALGLVQAHAQGHLSSVMGGVIVMYLLSLSIFCCSMVVNHMPIESKESAKKDFLQKLLLVLSIGRVIVGIIHIYRVVDTIAAVFTLLIMSAIYGFAYFLVRCSYCCNTEYCNTSLAAGLEKAAEVEPDIITASDGTDSPLEDV